MNISQIAWRLKHEQGEGNVFFHFRRLLQQHCYWQTSRQHISHWCAPRFIRPCSMHSRRSKYTNPTPPGRCCETRVWQDTHSHCWHGCCSSCHCNIRPAPQHQRTVDCIWWSEELPIFLNHCVTLPMFHVFTGCWHGIMFWKQGQTDCMGHVECLWRSHTRFLCFGC